MVDESIVSRGYSRKDINAKNPPKKKGISRRKFLGGAAALAGGAIAGGIAAATGALTAEGGARLGDRSLEKKAEAETPKPEPTATPEFQKQDLGEA